MATGSANSSTVRNIFLALIAGVVIGWWAFPAQDKRPGPEDRPVLRWIARAAKTFLWLAVFAEDPPPEIQPVRSEIGEDGYVKVDHGQGW